jgi:hypothetical protein
VTEPRIIAEVTDYETLRRAINAGREFRELAFSAMDDVAGMPLGYYSKVLSPGGSRRVTLDSLGPALGSTGMKLLLVEDLPAWERIKDRVGKRAAALVRNGTVHFSLSRRHLKKLASKGGTARAAKLLPCRRQAIAREAGRIGNLVRWGRVKSAARP